MAGKRVDVIVTVHVEEHCKFLSGCHEGHRAFFELLLERGYPLPLTLLIARDKDEDGCPACDRGPLHRLLEKGDVEIGLHVHPALSRFPPAEQRRIIEMEHRRLVKGVGVVPRTFSGGHWCINAATLRIVKDLGMEVDASVVPGCRVGATNGALARFSPARRSPYWVSSQDIDSEDRADGLLEMPVSVTDDGAIMDLSSAGLWEMMDYAFGMALHENPRHYLHLTFHSYDLLLPGGDTTFIYDKLLLFHERLNEAFDEVRGYTCSQYYDDKYKEDAL